MRVARPLLCPQRSNTAILEPPSTSMHLLAALYLGRLRSTILNRSNRWAPTLRLAPCSACFSQPSTFDASLFAVEMAAQSSPGRGINASGDEMYHRGALRHIALLSISAVLIQRALEPGCSNTRVIAPWTPTTLPTTCSPPETTRASFASHGCESTVISVAPIKVASNQLLVSSLINKPVVVPGPRSPVRRRRLRADDLSSRYKSHPKNQPTISGIEKPTNTR